jgi:hypothetical protein
MKIKLDKEENVLIVLCERKKANLKIIYKDIDTNEILEESLLEGFQIGEELDIELIPPENYTIKEKEEVVEEKEENSPYEEMLKEMQEFRKELEK